MKPLVPAMTMRTTIGLGVWLLALITLAAPCRAAESGTVVKVVDGDTIQIEIGAQVEVVRLIGVDTPETVDPRKPVEFFGREASEFTRRLALGKVVRLEQDPQGDTRDTYGRLLRYVHLPDGTLLNAEIIRQGYGMHTPASRTPRWRDFERWNERRGKPGVDCGARNTSRF